ncbi:MAG TPA: SpoIIIAH-like family protein [Thermoanaerobacterales bacterium]|nr:SpoIIIAH-like family protein [Thermoanaerobacterales bacterium]
MIIKKRTILIVIISCVLIATVYLYLNQDLETFKETTKMEKEILSDLIPTEHGNNSIRETNNDFFIEYKLKRDRLRSKEIEILQEIVQDPNIDTETRHEARDSLQKIIRDMENELIIENMIIGRGYDDSIIVLSKEFALVIVKSEGLEDKKVAQICDIVSNRTNLPLDCITISEYNEKM